MGGNQILGDNQCSRRKQRKLADVIFEMGEQCRLITQTQSGREIDPEGERDRDRGEIDR